MRMILQIALFSMLALLGAAAQAEQPTAGLSGVWQLVSTTEHLINGTTVDASKVQLILSDRSFSVIENGLVTHEGSLTTTTTANDLHAVDWD
jgi:hypothetical protein